MRRKVECLLSKTTVPDLDRVIESLKESEISWAHNQVMVEETEAEVVIYTNKRKIKKKTDIWKSRKI